MKPFLETRFQLIESLTELAMLNDRLSHLDKRADHKHGHGNCARGIQNGRCHDGAMLGKRARGVPATAAP